MQESGPVDRRPAESAAIRWRQSTVSPAYAAELVQRVAGGLEELGVRAGDRIGIVMRNSLELLIAHQASRSLGAHPVPVNWHADASDVTFVLDDCAAAVVVAHGDLLHLVHGPADVPMVVAAVPGSPLPAGAVDWRDLVAHGPRTREPSRPSAESIIYTSGTSGRPKGVRRLAASAEQDEAVRRMRARLYGSTTTTRLLVTAPLYHAAPLQFAQHVLATGELVVVEDRFDPDGFLRAIEEHRITHVFAVPTMFGRILALDETHRRAYDVSSLSFVLHAGAPCPPSLKQRIIDDWGPVVHEYYGSTELGPVTLCDSNDWLSRPGTVGRPLDGVDLAFFDPDTGAPAESTPAEIGVRNRVLPDFHYEGHDAARRELQRGGFVATGDIGYLDDDGFLFVSDRARDLIISGGVNLYPAEIEAAIQEVPGVADCAVFAVPDDDLGEVPAAVVQAPATLSVAEIDDHLIARLGRLKRPRVIEIRGAIPRQENGKIRKRLLREEFLATRSSRSAGVNDAR